MKTKIALFSLFVSLSLSGLTQEKSQFTKQLDAVLEAFKYRNAAYLKPVLAADYSIRGIPARYKAQILEQVLLQFPKFSTYTVTKEVKEKTGTRLLVSFKHTEGVYNCNFLINAQGLIRELNILEGAEIHKRSSNRP
jgi:hypothetical protein